MISQSVAIAISVVLFIATGIAIWWFMIKDDYNRPAWRALGIPVAMMVVAVGSLFWSLNDNYYDVKSGVVVAQDFTPAHMTPPTIIYTGKTTTVVPGHWVDDDWAIEIRGDNGHTGWIHFSTNVFAEYPIGSHYPHDR